MANYRLDPRQNIELQFNDILTKIVQNATLNTIRERAGKAVDKELGQTFRLISKEIVAQRASPGQAIQPFKPYLPAPWVEYDPVYERRKRKRVRHRRWFKYGAPHGDREGEAQLYEELAAVTPSEVLREVGNTEVVVRRSKSGVTLKMLPKTPLKLKGFEQNFGSAISEIAMSKLENRKRRYRALVGPAFAYVIDQRIPQVITNSLRRI